MGHLKKNENELSPDWAKKGGGPMKRNTRRKVPAVLPALPVLLVTALLFCLFSPFAAAQTQTEEWVETGRFGAEEPKPPQAAPGGTGLGDRWLYLGLRAGPSLRFYTPAEDTRFTGGDTLSVSLDAALYAGLQILPFLSLQAEAVFTWDNASLWAYRAGSGPDLYDRYTKEYTAFSFQFPLMIKFDFYPGSFRLSPFMGAYYLVAPGKIEASNSLNSDQQSLEYEISPPFGLLGGLSGAMKFGPGLIIADLRYAADLGEFKGRNGDFDTFKRGAVSLTVGYEFGFFTRGAGHE
jgi:hypothetical protein